MAKEIKIKIRDLHKCFGKKQVLNGVDLDLYKGESLVVIGGSGTGKSVLIKCIQGLLTPDSGSIEIDGIENSKLRDLLNLSKKTGCLRNPATAV